MHPESISRRYCESGDDTFWVAVANKRTILAIECISFDSGCTRVPYFNFFLVTSQPFALCRVTVIIYWPVSYSQAGSLQHYAIAAHHHHLFCLHKVLEACFCSTSGHCRAITLRGGSYQVVQELTFLRSRHSDRALCTTRSGVKTRWLPATLTVFLWRIGPPDVRRSAEVQVNGVPVDGESQKKRRKRGKKPKEKAQPGRWCGKRKDNPRRGFFLFIQHGTTQYWVDRLSVLTIKSN